MLRLFRPLTGMLATVAFFDWSTHVGVPDIP